MRSKYALVEESGFTKFSPRLLEQPIFYPVLNRKYACEIASRWNAKSGKKGYVLQFLLDDEYISKYEIQTVGAHYHQELWIPCEELDEFNKHIIGEITVVDIFA